MSSTYCVDCTASHQTEFVTGGKSSERTSDTRFAFPRRMNRYCVVALFEAVMPTKGSGVRVPHIWPRQNTSD